jgi:hypothetical protein
MEHEVVPIFSGTAAYNILPWVALRIPLLQYYYIGNDKERLLREHQVCRTLGSVYKHESRVRAFRQCTL